MDPRLNKQESNNKVTYAIKRNWRIAALVTGPILWLTLVVLTLRRAVIKDGAILVPVQPGVLLGINSTIRYIPVKSFWPFLYQN